MRGGVLLRQDLAGEDVVDDDDDDDDDDLAAAAHVRPLRLLRPAHHAVPGLLRPQHAQSINSEYIASGNRGVIMFRISVSPPALASNTVGAQNETCAMDAPGSLVIEIIGFY